MDKDQFENLVINKLDTLIKLLAANMFQGKPLSNGILFLAELGFQNKEIASIFGTTPNHVSKIKSEAKKSKKKLNITKKSKASDGEDSDES